MSVKAWKVSIRWLQVVDLFRIQLSVSPRTRTCCHMRKTCRAKTCSISLKWSLRAKKAIYWQTTCSNKDAKALLEHPTHSSRHSLQRSRIRWATKVSQGRSNQWIPISRTQTCCKLCNQKWRMPIQAGNKCRCGPDSLESMTKKSTMPMANHC